MYYKEVELGFLIVLYCQCIYACLCIAGFLLSYNCSIQLIYPIV